MKKSVVLGLRGRGLSVGLVAMAWWAAAAGCDSSLDLGEQAACARGERWCMGADGTGMCADLDSSPSHCGACGRTCASGMCLDGRCCEGGMPATCEAPTGGLRCVDLQTDARNCGSCGRSCGTAACIGGACCDAPGQRACADPTTGALRCIVTTADPNNCGACGATCRSGLCAGGRCCGGAMPAVCDDGDAAGECLDLSLDRNNCGACGVTCAAGTCVDGACCGGTECGGRCFGARYETFRADGDVEAIGVHAHDLDGDGRDDLIYMNQLSDNITVFWSDGRVLSARHRLPVGRVASELAVADVDEDGIVDLVFPMQGAGPPLTDRITILFGEVPPPEAEFPREFTRRVDLMRSGNPRWIAFIDVDRDGHLDMLVHLAEDECIALEPGDGTGSFGPSRCILSGTRSASPLSSLRAIDVDDDGFDELLDHEEYYDVDLIHWFSPTGEVVRSEPWRPQSPGSPYAIDVKDFDRDGDDDIFFTRVNGDGTTSMWVQVHQPGGVFEECIFEDSVGGFDAYGMHSIDTFGHFDDNGLIDAAGRTTCGYCSSNYYVYMRE